MSKPTKTRHPGSSAQDAHAIGGKGDFGVPESDVVERTYTSNNTKRSDPGSAPAHAGDDGSRTAGVGGNNSGVGSSSGGDLDTDIIGVGTHGAGLSVAGVDENETASSPDAVTASPTADRKQPPFDRVIHGTVTPSPDPRAATGQGADAASNPPARDDNSFTGEVSSDEATGRNDAGD